MLDHIAASVIDNFSEREFDAPFMALLRGAGFVDIHRTHGAVEFGKDFIATRLTDAGPVQYVFQSKAGDLNQSGWAALEAQLQLLRSNTLSHPSFDASVPRQAVLVITGRLTGQAQLACQNYVNRARQQGETPLEVWDHERLIELMVATLTAALDPQLTSAMVAAYGAIGEDGISARHLEAVSEYWCDADQPPSQAALWMAILAVELSKAHRLDLSCWLALALIRAAALRTHGTAEGTTDWMEVHRLGRLVFQQQALTLWRLSKNGDQSIAGLARANFEIAALVTYRVRCATLVELVGLLGLMLSEGEPERGLEIATWIRDFLSKHPGASEPVSDKWAVSYVPAWLLLCRYSMHAAVTAHLQRLGEWVVRRYKDSGGLAGPQSAPDAEIRQIFGTRSEVPRRRESYLASLVLDFAAFLGRAPLYARLLQDVRRADALPWSVVTLDDEDQYRSDGRTVAAESNIPYATELPPNGLGAASHLKEGATARYLDLQGRSWAFLAVSSILRDRHFPSSWHTLAQLRGLRT